MASCRSATRSRTASWSSTRPRPTLVRSIFKRFAKLGSATKLVRQLASENVRNRYGKLIDKGALYKMLNNRVYIGEAVHKGTAYPGEHQAIIDRRSLGQGPRHPEGEPAQAGRAPAACRRRRS